MSFKKEQWTNWEFRKPCPHCHTGILLPGNEKGFIKQQTPDSKFMVDNGYPYANYYFSTLLICNHCKERVIASGHFEEATSPIDEEGTIPRSVTPLFFIPTLHIINIPQKCPKEVGRELIKSFALYWIDPPSAANKIRVAVEKIMDNLKIKKTQINIKGKRVRLTLHSRLELYNAVNSTVASYLMSVKWIGNAGSHAATVTTENLLDVYSILQECLNELYSSNRRELISLSKNINKRKGPVKKK